MGVPRRDLSEDTDHKMNNFNSYLFSSIDFFIPQIIIYNNYT
jgi:hypothetical protein